MNYRHRYHAGNFADVMKHAVLVQLVRGMQRKDKGFLYLDTHAGRGSYDLATAAHGDTLERKPEHPDGIGRLADRRVEADVPAAFQTAQPVAQPAARSAAQPAAQSAAQPAAQSEIQSETDRDIRLDFAPLDDYLRLIRAFDRRRGNLELSALRYYPGSPWLVRALVRVQDRMALCEKHPAEYSALRREFLDESRVSTHEFDGYTAIRAMLPPPEKRALILIDPPYEAQDEFEKIAQAVREILHRMSAATIAVWYPLTERARADAFLDRLAMLNPPPTFAAELTIAGETAPYAPKMRGCGIVVVNPPWQIDQTLRPMLVALSRVLAQAPGGGAGLDWIARE